MTTSTVHKFMIGCLAVELLISTAIAACTGAPPAKPFCSRGDYLSREEMWINVLFATAMITCLLTVIEMATACFTNICGTIYVAINNFLLGIAWTVVFSLYILEEDKFKKKVLSPERWDAAIGMCCFLFVAYTIGFLFAFETVEQFRHIQQQHPLATNTAASSRPIDVEIAIQSLQRKPPQAHSTAQRPSAPLAPQNTFPQMHGKQLQKSECLDDIASETMAEQFAIAASLPPPSVCKKRDQPPQHLSQQPHSQAQHASATAPVSPKSKTPKKLPQHALNDPNLLDFISDVVAEQLALASSSPAPPEIQKTFQQSLQCMSADPKAQHSKTAPTTSSDSQKPEKQL